MKPINKYLEKRKQELTQEEILNYKEVILKWK